MEELELKFEVPPCVAASLRAALRERGARSTRLRARYFDTADDALARQGVVLRLREEGRRWVQALKGRGDSAVSRFEHEVTLPAVRGEMPTLDLARHTAVLAEPAVRDALASLSPGAPLIERYGSDVRRLACKLTLDGATVEMALDVGDIVAGDRRQPLCELEFELKAGAREALFELAQEWVGVGGLWLDVRPKSLRALRLARGEVQGPPVRARPVALDQDMSGGTMLRVVLHVVLEQVLANASEIAASEGGEEHVHQLRIGLRRLRTALRELGALSTRIEPQWDATLAQAAQALGALRDQQAVADAVEPLLVGAGAPRTRWTFRATGPSAADIARDVRLQRALIGILGLASSEEALDRRIAPHEAKAQIAQRLQRLHRQVRKAGKSFESLPAELQHRARKRLKRLRYLSEFAVGLWKDDVAARYIGRLERAQDALGTHNDITVAAQSFRHDSEEEPRSLYAAGYLSAYLKRTALECSRALERVNDKARFW